MERDAAEEAEAAAQTMLRQAKNAADCKPQPRRRPALMAAETAKMEADDCADGCRGRPVTLPMTAQMTAEEARDAGP